ncbi:MAG: hypothetical protein M1812_006817 [Candelaria pacifica]|nr:MAG: hypothetical protein M1812_006817 [Candelaria pacifica]
MTTYNNGRRGPNVSQFIANLNTIPSPHDMAAQSQDGLVEADLALFTNTQFFDFDQSNLDTDLVEYDREQEQRARRDNATAHKNNMKGMEFMSGEYPFSDYSAFPNVLADGSTGVPQPMQPYSTQSLSSPVLQSPTSTVGAGEKRPAEIAFGDSSSPQSLEEASRMAAEEDKRRRNTAASARFRVKKKQREQALERTAKEQSNKASALEARIQHLEMENKWLKNLITEKNENKEDITELWRKFNKENSPGSKVSERKDGVGTTEVKKDA